MSRMSVTTVTIKLMIKCLSRINIRAAAFGAIHVKAIGIVSSGLTSFSIHY